MGRGCWARLGSANSRYEAAFLLSYELLPGGGRQKGSPGVGCSPLNGRLGGIGTVLVTEFFCFLFAVRRTKVLGGRTKRLVE
jgi:hypothetical protein